MSGNRLTVLSLILVALSAGQLQEIAVDNRATRVYFTDRLSSLIRRDRSPVKSNHTRFISIVKDIHRQTEIQTSETIFPNDLRLTTV